MYSVLGISKTTVAGCGKKVGGGSALQQGWVHQQQVQSYGASCPSKDFESKRVMCYQVGVSDCPLVFGYDVLYWVEG